MQEDSLRRDYPPNYPSYGPPNQSLGTYNDVHSVKPPLPVRERNIKVENSKPPLPRRGHRENVVNQTKPNLPPRYHTYSSQMFDPQFVSNSIPHQGTDFETPKPPLPRRRSHSLETMTNTTEYNTYNTPQYMNPVDQYSSNFGSNISSNTTYYPTQNSNYHESEVHGSNSYNTHYSPSQQFSNQPLENGNMNYPHYQQLNSTHHVDQNLQFTNNNTIQNSNSYENYRSNNMYIPESKPLPPIYAPPSTNTMPSYQDNLYDTSQNPKNMHSQYPHNVNSDNASQSIKDRSKMFESTTPKTKPQPIRPRSNTVSKDTPNSNSTDWNKPMSHTSINHSKPQQVSFSQPKHPIKQPMIKQSTIKRPVVKQSPAKQPLFKQSPIKQPLRVEVPPQTLQVSPPEKPPKPLSPTNNTPNQLKKTLAPIPTQSSSGPSKQIKPDAQINNPQEHVKTSTLKKNTSFHSMVKEITSSDDNNGLYSAHVAYYQKQALVMGEKDFVIMYAIEVSKGPKKWTVYRRFNQFFKLDQDLKKKKHLAKKAKMLPPKDSSCKKDDPNLLDMRMASFNNYLREILVSKDIQNSSVLYSFLEPIQLGDTKP